jgi:hypothetical protein
MNRNGHTETPQVKNNLMKKHRIMNEYFGKTFSNFIQSYQRDENKLETDSLHHNCIWMCWWQGIDQAPEIIRSCVKSVQKHADGHRLILITEDNYRDYVDIPEWLIKKKEEGIISRTHFSDVLRVSLLARHGGLWLDSTFFCVDTISDYFQLPIWSIKRPDYGHASVACGYFANYSLGCQFEYRWVFAVIRDYLLEYWKTNDIMVDYLFLDYLIVLIQKHHPDIAQLFFDIPSNNPCGDDLQGLMNKPYDLKRWQQLRKDTRLFKLTWKQEFQLKHGAEDTFYGKLINEML